MSGSVADNTDRYVARYERGFFCKPTTHVARALLGSILVHSTPAGIMAGRIVECEAYLGPADKAAHTYGGRLSERNRAMFGPGGYAYIFQIYGMYWCLNCVTGAEGKPQAVLIRGLEPLDGIDLMRLQLGSPNAPIHTLCRGPGKLCRAMGITRKLYGEDLCGTRLFLVPARLRRGEKVGVSRRINIDYAEEYIAKAWRFYIAGHPSVSGPAALRR